MTSEDPTKAEWTATAMLVKELNSKHGILSNWKDNFEDLTKSLKSSPMELSSHSQSMTFKEHSM